jgi:hypothetical protein
MESLVKDEETENRLRRQRNFFAAIAIFALASIGVAIPRKVSNYRELRATNAHLVELQTAIIDTQWHIRSVEGELLDVQREILRQEAL